MVITGGYYQCFLLVRTSGFQRVTSGCVSELISLVKFPGRNQRISYPPQEVGSESIFTLYFIYFLKMWTDSESDDDLNDIENVCPTRTVCVKRLNFANLSAAEFRENFRMTPVQAEQLLLKIGCHLETKSKRLSARSAQHKLLLSMRYFATNGYYKLIADGHGYNKMSVCRSVKEVVRTLNRYLFQESVKWPESPEQCQKIVTKFHSLAGKVIDIFKCTISMNKSHDSSISSQKFSRIYCIYGALHSYSHK